MKKYIAISLLLTMPLGAYTPTNVDQPYDMSFLLQSLQKGAQWINVGMRGEYVTGACAFDPEQHYVPPTQIWSQSESSLAMLEGHATNTELHRLANNVRGMQDGTRGMYKVTGSMSRRQATIDMVVPFSLPTIPGRLSLGVHLPIIYAAMDNVAWKNQTKTQTLDDDVVRASLAADHKSLSAFAQRYGDLDINSQHREGIGDVAVMFRWQAYFSQQNKRLNNVRVDLRGGISLPTSHQVDINKSFDIDFGHDGTVAVPLGAGLCMDMGQGIRMGADVGVTLLGRRTKKWRLKTSWAQTENLLLATGDATREYGPEWKFTVYSQLHSPYAGLTGTMGYQFLKHTDSTLFAQDETMSSSLLNTSQTVEVSESHNLIFAFHYAPAITRQWRVKPEISVHGKYPFTGRRMMSGYIVGAGMSVRF